MIQKAHRDFVLTKLRLVEGNKIQDLFTSIQGFFHLSFTVLFSIGYEIIFRVRGMVPQCSKKITCFFLLF